MNKLLKSVISGFARDDFVKKNITEQLANTVKEIQYQSVEENVNNLSRSGDDAGESFNGLCNIIEAMFLHGLKGSLGSRFRRAIADVDEKPDPNFWPPLLVISHRQIINQITNLNRITSEVGQCRAWIRLALNDSLLSSYLMSVRQENAAIKSFYKPAAYMRDSELLDIAQRLIEGVETFKNVTLSVNSSLLNTWPLQSLYLAGIWAPTLKTCPLAPCDDVVAQSNWEMVAPSSSDSCSLNSTVSVASEGSTMRQVVALNEDEVLKIILAKNDDCVNNVGGAAAQSSTDVSKSSDSDRLNYNMVGNSLKTRSGWSFDENERLLTETNEISDIPAESKSMEGSFNALIESYNMYSGGFMRGGWTKFEGDVEESATNQVEVEIESNPEIALETTDDLSTQIGRIPRQKGLDVQNYECAEPACRKQLVINQKLNFCAFTGDLFCTGCMSDDPSPIPARIIHNWDFKRYELSRRSRNYIDEVKEYPLIDFKVCNPNVYRVVAELQDLQILRTQLNFLRAYLYTCREPIIEQFQKQMWPKEYLYEHIHQYSISDLFEIQNGGLAQKLQMAVDFGREHVSACWLCSQKGFVCEICNNPKALFPFDVKNVYRCEKCNGVYHKGCLNSNKLCPKCERRRKREDLPLLGATVE